MKYTLVNVNLIESISRALEIIEAIEANEENRTKRGELQARAQKKVDDIKQLIDELRERDKNQFDIFDYDDDLDNALFNAASKDEDIKKGSDLDMYMQEKKSASTDQVKSAIHQETSKKANEEQANDNTVFIYARTSTTDQNVIQQADFLRREYPNASKLFTDQVSGKNLDRPAFKAMLDQVKDGDSIIVLSVSRLGRNTLEVLQFIEEMKNQNVKVKVHDLGGIDVTSHMGKIVLTTLAAVAEMQREEILDKQRIGIERAKAEGKYKGKQVSPKTIKKLKEAMKLINETGLSKEKAARAAGISIASLYRHIQENKCKEAERVMEDRFYSPEEAARYCGVSFKIFRAYLDKKEKEYEFVIRYE